ncbi:18067_t:CDS:2 [Cetraspora pellucida]|uniref:18067_t:CDS:1 n=1 Tax=Cetraspora pellucida TaxID=1433469 RepID=A0ACA9KPM4_9GLOM|nr:18067_t:CDS:2 [Cetraspora pellucida]
MTQINYIANSQYAKEASNYIKILNDLRRIGAQLAVNLPTIVFCGNQSAGKSSLLEAISGVKLPRSDGTCTRCVMELRLSEVPKIWSCQVSLRKEYDEHETRLSNPIETKFGSPIDDPDKVELMARRAQKALLNPMKQSDEYIDWDFKDQTYEDDSQLNGLKFTKNVVCMEIKGPNVPNLSLIDLPGIIRHTEKAEDRRFIPLTEELVKEYIKNEKSIIIATISCKDEIDNQAIVTLAKEADPLGVRTLGVLTKPDMIEEGTHNSWLKIMRGEANPLELGYYVVKNPTKVQRIDNIRFEDARLAEIEFFEKEDPWSSFHLQERIGVKNLQNKLSELLIKAIKRGLPGIRKEVEEKLDEACKDLEKLPLQLSDNPRIDLFRLIKNCTTIIKEKTTCSNNQIELWKSLNDQFALFKVEFYALRPIFSINSSNNYIGKNSSGVIDILEDFIEGSPINKSDISTDQLQQLTETQVTEIIKNSHGRLLPGFVPYSAAQTIIQGHQKQWQKPAINCLNAVYEIMIKVVNETIESTFSRFPGLVGRMGYKAQALLEECKKQTTDHISFTYKMEQTTYPFTLDKQMMTNLKTEYLKSLHEAVKIEFRKPTETLEVVAIVLAYLKIAIKRYVDVVSMTIIHTFIDEFSDHIEEKLMEIFIHDKDGSIDELIKEDDGIKYQRERLLGREKLLREVLDKLINFGVHYKSNSL